MSKMVDKIIGKVGDLQPRVRAHGEGPTGLGEPKSAPSRLLDAIAQTEPLREQLQRAEQELEVLRRGTVLLSELVEVEGRRRKLTPEQFEDLKANLSMNPLAHRIVVRPHPGGGFEIVAGHNRVQAYRELGRTEIPATIEHMEDMAAIEGAFYSNLFASELTDYEKYLGFKKIQEQSGDNQTALAQKAGVAQSQIAKLFSFGKLPPAALTLLERRPALLGAESAMSMTQADPDLIVEALKKLDAGEIKEQARAVAYALKTGDSGKKPERQTYVIKSGRAHFAEISVRGGMLSVKLKNESNSERVLEKLKELLSNLANQ
jgi:ParB family chromosome partitioning protein